MSETIEHARRRDGSGLAGLVLRASADSVLHAMRWIVLAGCVACVVFAFDAIAARPGAWPTQGGGTLILERLSALLLDCAGTAVVEELLFRGALLWALAWRFRKVFAEPQAGDRAAVWVAAVVFALLHLSPELTHVFDAGFAAVSVWTIPFAVAKATQAVLFGFCMGAVVLRTRSLIVPVIVHFAFDLLYFAPGFLGSGAFPTSYLTGGFADALALGLTILLFLPAARECCRWLR